MNLLRRKSKYLAYTSWLSLLVSGLAFMNGQLMLCIICILLYALLRQALPHPDFTRNTDLFSGPKLLLFISVMSFTLLLKHAGIMDLFFTEMWAQRNSKLMMLCIWSFVLYRICTEYAYLRKVPAEVVGEFYELKK